MYLIQLVLMPDTKKIPGLLMFVLAALVLPVAQAWAGSLTIGDVQVHISEKIKDDAVRQRIQDYHVPGEFEALMKKRLKIRDLYDDQSSHRLDITITDFRLRSAGTAVAFSIFAGKDRIVVDVNVKQQDKVISSFKKKISTGKGGFAAPAPTQRVNDMMSVLSIRLADELARRLQK